METAAIFLPALAALIAGLGGRVIGHRAAEIVTSAAVTISALLSCLLFWQIAVTPLGDPTAVAGMRVIELFTWLDVGSLEASWALRLDTLSAVMLAVVTVVSAAVHIYAIGYMHADPGRARFMAYLSLFTFTMLMLVTADNLIQLFFGWEGVGLSSYLLIGFWYRRARANDAAIKAFIVNRVGDFGLTLGIFAVYLLFDSVAFDVILDPARIQDAAALTVPFLGADLPGLTLACTLLFIGAMGKSAQLFLHTWLPDAMEGPTPVSALIHAATMVTAGVFLMARISPMLEFTPLTLQIITVLGALTALVAATIGLTRFDIKRVIAYSTMSQLGYMFFAIGVSAYGAAIFHLMTHAFFKALLFLGAGSVIHGLSDEQDMRHMGGIHKQLPMTHIFMLVGCLALAGIPIFAGYYSKDTILEAAFVTGSGSQSMSAFGYLAWGLGVAVALLTALYAFRMLILTFYGRSRVAEKVRAHIHESPAVMWVPMLVLMIGAITTGKLFEALFVGASRDRFWGESLAPSRLIDRLGAPDPLATLESAHGGGHAAAVAHQGGANLLPGWAVAAPTVMAGLGIALAVLAWWLVPGLPARAARVLKPLYALFNNKWFFDEAYDLLICRPAGALARLLFRHVDLGLIDRFGPDGMARLTLAAARRLSALQTGYVYHYAFVMVTGLVILASWYVYQKSMTG